jgi:hypothetical protein
MPAINAKQASIKSLSKPLKFRVLAYLSPKDIFRLDSSSPLHELEWEFLFSMRHGNRDDEGRSSTSSQPVRPHTTQGGRGMSRTKFICKHHLVGEKLYILHACKMRLLQQHPQRHQRELTKGDISPSWKFQFALAELIALEQRLVDFEREESRLLMLKRE